MIGDGGIIGPRCMGDGDISRFCSRDIDIFIPGTQRADDVEFRECCEALRPVEPLVRTARMRSPSFYNLHAIRRCGGIVYFKARGRKPGKVL
jgi:hypothetical protein